MPVLGAGGKLKLQRKPVEKTLYLDQSRVDTTCNKIKGAPSWLWNGDHIAGINLPIYCDEDGLIPGRVSGYASYFGSKWYLGPNRTQITSNTDKFYKTNSEEYPAGKAGDAANFYAKNGVGPTPEDCGADGDYWVHVDSAGWISFYTDRCSALAGSEHNRVDLAPIYGDLELTGYGTVDYQNAKWICDDGFCSGLTGDYIFSDVQDEDTDTSICESAPQYDFPVAATDDYENADVLPRKGGGDYGWKVICGLREWSLDLTADDVDTTSVSEKFGNAVKSLVRGGGGLEYFIDRQCFDDQHDNSLMVMQLLFLTEKGCEADAEFWLIDEPLEDPPYCNKRIGGGLFYSAKILVTSTAVNLRPTELVAGSASFVTTEEISLKVNP
jgi:hypothetical protein